MYVASNSDCYSTYYLYLLGSRGVYRFDFEPGQGFHSLLLDLPTECMLKTSRYLNLIHTGSPNK